jgi:hypothetical protein
VFCETKGNSSDLVDRPDDAIVSFDGYPAECLGPYKVLKYLGSTRTCDILGPLMARSHRV